MEKIDSPTFFIGNQKKRVISFGAGELTKDKIDLTLFSDIKNGYGEVQGESKLRELIARENPGTSCDEYIITNGASEALDLVLRSLYIANGKILIPRPYYYSYPPSVKLSHMEVMYYSLKKGKIDISDISKLINQCHAIIINSPGNPTGTVQSQEALREIERITQENNKYIISDDIYSHFQYVPSYYSFNSDYVIKINSFSKIFNMGGYRVGYAHIKEKDLMKRVIEIKTQTSMNTNIISQEIAYHYLKEKNHALEKEKLDMEEKALYMYNQLKEFGLDLWKPEGAFYLFPKMNDPQKVMQDLYYLYNVIVYNGEWFGDSERVRFSFATSWENIKEGLKRVGDYLEEEYLIK